MQAQVREVLRRVLVDDDYLNEMLNDPERALRDYDLTDEERSILASPERDLLQLMRIGGEGSPQGLFLVLIILLELDLTEFITSFHVDVTLDFDFGFSDPDVEARRAVHQEQLASLASAVGAARAGADRLERIQELLEVVSGATELARRSSTSQQPVEDG